MKLRRRAIWLAVGLLIVMAVACREPVSQPTPVLKKTAVDPLSGVVGQFDNARYEIAPTNGELSAGLTIVVKLPGTQYPDERSFAPTVTGQVGERQVVAAPENQLARYSSPSRTQTFYQFKMPAAATKEQPLIVSIADYRLPLRSVVSLPVAVLARLDGGQEVRLVEFGAAVRAGQAVRVLVDVSARDGRPLLRAAAVDRWGNPGPSADRRFDVRLDGASPLPALVLDEEGYGELSLPTLPAGLHRISVTQAGREWGRSGPFDAATTDRVLWGDLHSHTGYSDAFTTATTADALRYAVRTAHLDFAAITDHVEAVWGPPLSRPIWAEVGAATRAANGRDGLTAFLGYEWTGSFPYAKNWPANEGHATVIFPGDDGDPCGVDRGQCATLATMLTQQTSRAALIFQHHTVAAWAPANVLMEANEAVPVIEIISSHGASECLDCPGVMREHVTDPGHTAQDALLAGRRLGFIGGSDNHHARPGARRYPGWERLDMDAGGMTGVFATANTREAIIAALRERRCYATTGARLLLDFRLGNTLMGGVAPAGSPARVTWRVNGVERVAKVEILRGDLDAKRFVTAFSSAPDTLDASGAWTDPQPPTRAVYYLRVTQIDGEMAWSSPIWTSR